MDSAIPEIFGIAEIKMQTAKPVEAIPIIAMPNFSNFIKKEINVN
jgi:hypothetical protein